MLIRFVVSNFLSFDEEREFNMLAGNFKTHKHHVYKAGKIEVLKSAAIYGANGAGKSSLIKAIDSLKDIVDNGIVTKSFNEKKFRLNKDNIDKPISFEIEFSVDKKIYSYGINFNGGIVMEEWLYESGITVEDRMIFERKQNKGKIEIKLSQKYMKTAKQKYLVELMEENLLKKNELLISKNENLKIVEIKKAKDWIVNNLVIIYPGSKFGGLVSMMTISDRFAEFANGLLNTFDTGVSKLEVATMDFEKFVGEEDEDLRVDVLEEVNNGHSVILSSPEKGSVLVVKENEGIYVKYINSIHKDNNNNNVSFELDQESDGTQRLLDFIPAFDLIIRNNVTFVIDEMDQSLHPALLYSLIKKIMADKSTKGQLVFTTHESNLLDLDIFRQDEIWFVEKNKAKNSTELYSLSEYKPRYDLDVRKGYLRGRFGAIPFLVPLQDLNWNDNA